MAKTNTRLLEYFSTQIFDRSCAKKFGGTYKFATYYIFWNSSPPRFAHVGIQVLENTEIRQIERKKIKSSILQHLRTRE